MPVHAHATQERLFELPDDPSAAGTARRAIRDVLGEWGVAQERIDDLAVVVSELAGNAVSYAAAPYRLRLVLAGSDLGVEVIDGSPSILPRAPLCTGADAEGGRGLAVVTALAGPWHVRVAPDGALPAPPTPPTKSVYVTVTV